MKKMAKIELSGFAEMTYLVYDFKDNQFKPIAVPRGLMLNRRKKVSKEEIETGCFNPADGCDMVEHWLYPCEELSYIHTCHQLTGEQQDYVYNAEINEYVPVDTKIITQMKEKTAREAKKDATLAFLLGKPIEKARSLKRQKGSFSLLDDNKEKALLADMEKWRTKKKFCCIDYIATDEKVFCYEHGEWVPVEPENIFYRFAGPLMCRRAYSYLPCEPDTFIKVLRQQVHYKQSTGAHYKDTVGEHYYHNGPEGGYFSKKRFKKSGELQAFERELDARAATKPGANLLLPKDIFEETL